MEPLQCENDFLGELLCKIHKTKNSFFLSLVLFIALLLLMQGMLGLKQSMGEITSGCPVYQQSFICCFYDPKM